jgi:hypothetical protein
MHGTSGVIGWVTANTINCVGSHAHIFGLIGTEW